MCMCNKQEHRARIQSRNINTPKDQDVKNMSVEPLNNELIKYENIGISFDNRKVLSGFKPSERNPQHSRKLQDSL